MELHDPRRRKKQPQKNLEELAQIAAERAEAHARVEAAVRRYEGLMVQAAAIEAGEHEVPDPIRPHAATEATARYREAVAVLEGVLAVQLPTHTVRGWLEKWELAEHGQKLARAQQVRVQLIGHL